MGISVCFERPTFVPRHRAVLRIQVDGQGQLASPFGSNCPVEGDGGFSEPAPIRPAGDVAHGVPSVLRT